jgi:hypothetical protein
MTMTTKQERYTSASALGARTANAALERDPGPLEIGLGIKQPSAPVDEAAADVEQ